MTVADEQVFFTTVEAARYLRLSHRTLKRYRVTGEGPVFNRLGGRVRYRREHLDAWAAERERVSTVDPGPPTGGAGNGTGERPGPALRCVAVAMLAAAAAMAAPEPAHATTDTTFGDPLDTVEGTVGGSGGHLAVALAVDAALVGPVLRFNATQPMGAAGVGIRARRPVGRPLSAPLGPGRCRRRGTRSRRPAHRQRERVRLPAEAGALRLRLDAESDPERQGVRTPRSPRFEWSRLVLRRSGEAAGMSRVGVFP